MIINLIKNEIKDLIILKKSIDARQKHVKINLKIDVYINEEHLEKVEKTKYKNVSKSKESNYNWSWTCWFICSS